MDKILPANINCLVIDSQHIKYLTGKPLHEAGYDSLLTAQVLIRLSAQLRDKPANLKEISHPIWPNPNSNNPSMADPVGMSRCLSQITQRGTDGKVDKPVDIDEPSTGSPRGVASETLWPGVAGIERSTHRKRPCQSPVNWQEPTGITRVGSIFAHPTKFDLLTDQTEESIVLPNFKIMRYSSAPLGEAPSLPAFQEDHLERKEMLMPSFGTDFWKAYCNKLRVFGTAEGVCDLTNV
jgi:poly(A)-specific ribonuclease